MGGEDIRNKAEELKGAAKEKFGDATDNEDLQAEGAAEKAKANVKQTFEDGKDNLEDATDAAADKVKSTFDR
ncbi:MAG TPA: CsbD family protein [Aeromicrobium sp.]|nr:CsbD family protein [Aeromicrobium sp.]